MSISAKAVITDIEGTTSPMSFVTDVLFPYTRKNLKEYLRAHETEPDVVILLNNIRADYGKLLTVEEIISMMLGWIDMDRKVTALKMLQGLVWENGYKQGNYQGQLFPDVVEKLREWHKQGIGLYVYSSGSVQEQKLLFEYSDSGDLSSLFSGYFDTHIGQKREPSSYLKISREIKTPVNQILFLSDMKQELDAAAQIGMQTIWLVRDEDVLDEAASHTQVRDFNAIDVSLDTQV